MKQYTINPIGKSLIGIYDAIAIEMGEANQKNIRYDCRKANVAENIQDELFNFYRDENPQLSEEDLRVSVVMLLAISGPKVNKSLPKNTVEVDDGFIEHLKDKGERK